MKQRKKRVTALAQVRKGTPRFGGRATAGGVNYEVRVAAFIAVKMLSGNRCSVWEDINGADVLAITLQAPEPVDDVVVSLGGDAEACVFISAKERNGAIALTHRSPAFTDTVEAFVRQFHKLPAAVQAKSRLVWAVPSSVGRAAVHELPDILNTHRIDAGDTSISEFLRGRQVKEQEALKALLSVAKKAWKQHSGNSPADDELRRFLRQMYVEVYDFGVGQRLESQAESYIRSHVIADPGQAKRVWEKLEHFFARVDQRGVRVTPASLRQALSADGLTLKSPPDYAQDIARLRELTARNLTRLKEHTTLRFGQKPTDLVHIDRTEELSNLIAAARSGHLLITGEPGCGKSGLIHPLIEALQKDGFPVVLLLAEEIFGRDWKGSANLPDFTHALDKVLANWPDGACGFLITDALDAVRDIETQKRLRHLLRDVQAGKSGWTVIASVRKFDLEHGRELREAFPGLGVVGHDSKDLPDVAHFHLTNLSEAQLDELSRGHTEIHPFIESARRSAKSGGIHRSPFYLRLAAELLRDGVPPLRLADWNSPAVLLRKFWDARIKYGSGAGEREVALQAICRRIVDSRSMMVSLKELSLGVPERNSVDDLRSCGILQTPTIQYGTPVGGDEIRFTHHLLHDYAIARSLIPETPMPFCDFAIRESLLPIFYRQSFMFALEELWDADAKREGFWKSALRLESISNLYGITRILAPILAGRRVETLADLQPLLIAVGSGGDANSPGQKALRHLASGLQDADADAIRAGEVGWCAFAEQLAGLLPASASIEEPLVHILARLNAIGSASTAPERLSLNAAARGLLAHHIAKEVSKGWRYASQVGIEALCRTYATAPTITELALLSLLTPERLALFPHDDLFNLSRSIKHLSPEGSCVVLRLFEAAFAAEPATGEWEDQGSVIMGMRFQTSDQWNNIHHILAEYYETSSGADVTLLTEAVCIAWNAVVRRRSRQRSKKQQAIRRIQFRGVSCELIEDYGHIWNRSHDPEENRILSHFEKLLRVWAAASDTTRLNAALDRFAIRNRTSLLWTVFLEVGAEYPSTLGILLESVLNEPLFLTHLDYAHGGTVLFGALHKSGNATQRMRLEKLILNLPKKVRLPKGQRRVPIPSWVEYAQNRLLGALEDSKIILQSVQDLRRAREATNPLPSNLKREPSSAEFVRASDEEELASQGINLTDSASKEMLRMRGALKPFQEHDKNKLDLKEIESHWPVIQQCERASKRYAKRQPKMAEELWGHLAGACENIARHATWRKASERWKTVRRILLKAATDPVPRATDDEDTKEDRVPSWGWPSPRLDAARGLPFLCYRLGYADNAVAAALRRLCLDKSHPLRFNLAQMLAVLEQPSPDLMWELTDKFIAKEQKFSVLDAVLSSFDQLWARAPERVMPRLRLVADRAMQSAPANHHIHETLAHTYLFHFLRTGHSKCEAFITDLITECDSLRASHALDAQLHTCRSGDG